MEALSPALTLADANAVQDYAIAPLTEVKSERLTPRQEEPIKPGVYWRGQRRWHRHDARTERLVLSALAHSRRAHQRKQRLSPWPMLSKLRTSAQHRRRSLNSGGSSGMQQMVVVDTRTAGCITTRRRPLGFGYIINMSLMEQEDICTGIKTQIMIVRPRKADLVSTKKQRYLEWHPMSSLERCDLLSSPASCTRSKTSQSGTSANAPLLGSMSADSVQPSSYTPLALTWHEGETAMEEPFSATSSERPPPAFASTSASSLPSDSSQ